MTYSAKAAERASERQFLSDETPGRKQLMHRSQRKLPKIQKSRGFLLCFFSGWYPPPGTLPNSNLLKRGFGSGAGGGRSGAGLAHDCVLNRTERVHARAVQGDRVSVRKIAAGCTRRSERITTLGAGRQL